MEPNQRILDDRPKADAMTPIALLYHGFGTFLDTFNRLGDGPSIIDERQRQLEKAVDNFANEMADYFKDKEMRRDRGLNRLNKILAIDHHKELMPASIGSVCSDGHFNGPLGTTACVVEFQNEPANNNSMPMVELVGYIARSQLQAMDRLQAVFKGWNVPCVGLTVVGMLIIPGPSYV